MLKNYIKTAVRNFLRQKTLSVINILGLSIGMACFILFLLYTVNEFHFDGFHPANDQLYRVVLKVQDKSGQETESGTYHPMPLGPALKADLPDVEAFFRLREPWGESFARVTPEDVRRVKVSFADPDFFRSLGFRFLYGQPQLALDQPNSLVLTEDKALELFGTRQAMGRSLAIKFDGEFQTFTVTGITENIPSNSSLGYELMGSFHFLEASSFGKQSGDNWHRSSLQTYVKLRQGSGLPNDVQRLLGVRLKYYPNEAEDLKKWGVQWDTTRPFATYGLQPLAAIHLNPKIPGATVDSIDPKNVWMLLGIASVVLLIACINFTTLSIGRLAGRAKEVGVRKVVGGERRQLVFQFLAEALLMALLSAMLGLGLSRLLLPYFNELSGRELFFTWSSLAQVSWMLGAVVLGVGLLAGIYPALVLSGFRPVEVLKAKFRLSGSNFFTRSLVTIQFSLSVALIICTLVILRQIRFMGERHPGFEKENVVVVDASETESKRIFPLFREKLIGQAGINGIASAELSLGDGEGWSQVGFEYGGKHRQVFEFFVDDQYLQVLGMKLLTGRNFDFRIASDTISSVVINETMMKEFGWNLQNVLGQKLTGYYEDSASFAKMPVVVGVVRDFNYRPMKEKVEPQLFHCFSGYEPFKFFVRTRPGATAAALSAIQASWKELVPEYPLKFSFLDENLFKFYRAEQRWQGIAGWAGGISIFLACLGLFGLAALATVNRTKEIGIRKVLGASVFGIIGLLSKDFLKLVGASLVLACPVAWYVMNKWLQDYAYRIDIGVWIFVLAGGFALGIAFLTVGSHAFRAARTNPTRSLRTE